MQPVTAVASLAPATLPEGDFPAAAAAAPNHFEAPAEKGVGTQKQNHFLRETLPHSPADAANHSEAPAKVGTHKITQRLLGNSRSSSKRSRNPKVAPLVFSQSRRGYSSNHLMISYHM